MTSKKFRAGFGLLTSLIMTMGAGLANAKDLNIAWVHATAAAQSEQRVKAGFEEWLKEKGYKWKVSFLDSGGSGERTASNIQDATSRGVDAIIVTMADLRAS